MVILQYSVQDVAMRFKSYIANTDILHQHISECIRKSRTYKLSYLEGYYSRQDLINDCWIYCLDSSKGWAQEVTTWYNNRAITCNDSNRRLRQRVKIAVRNFIALKYFKHVRMEKIMSRFALYNIALSNVASIVSTLDQMNLSEKEEILITWKMGILEEEEVMSVLGCCQKTLYNRWDKLKSKIKEAYNK